jgi:hypothetical protein
VDRLESFAEWAGDQITESGGGESNEESQLTEEDATRYSQFLQTVIEQCEGGMAELDPESQHARALKLMGDEGKALLELTKEIALVDEPDVDAPADEGEGGSDERH